MMLPISNCWSTTALIPEGEAALMTDEPRNATNFIEDGTLHVDKAVYDQNTNT